MTNGNGHGDYVVEPVERTDKRPDIGLKIVRINAGSVDVEFHAPGVQERLTMREGHGMGIDMRMEPVEPDRGRMTLSKRIFWIQAVLPFVMWALGFTLGLLIAR